MNQASALGSNQENEPQIITLPWKYQSVILQYFKEKEYRVGLDLFSAFLKIKNYTPPRILILTVIVDLIWLNDNVLVVYEAHRMLQFLLAEYPNPLIFEACFKSGERSGFEELEEGHQDDVREQERHSIRLRRHAHQAKGARRNELIEGDFWGLIEHMTDSLERSPVAPLQELKLTCIYQFFFTLMDRVANPSAMLLGQLFDTDAYWTHVGLDLILGPLLHHYAPRTLPWISRVLCKLLASQVSYYKMMNAIEFKLEKKLSVAERMAFYQSMPLPFCFYFMFKSTFPTLASPYLTAKKESTEGRLTEMIDKAILTCRYRLLECCGSRERYDREGRSHCGLRKKTSPPPMVTYLSLLEAALQVPCGPVSKSKQELKSTLAVVEKNSPELRKYIDKLYLYI